MVMLFLLTMLVVAMPTLHIMNARYVQRIALLIGASQMACLALAGKIDHQLSEWMVNSVNHALSFSVHVLVQKLLLLVA